MPAFTNAKTHVPALFQEIMRNHNEQQAILDKGETMSTEEWCRLRELKDEMKEYRRAAEKALHWNADKGNLA